MPPSVKGIIVRYVSFATVGLFGMIALQALAQAPSGLDPTIGVAPSREIGVGDPPSQPDKVGNHGTADRGSMIAPALPSSSLGADAAARDHLRAARVALVDGRAGEAQQSLEMAETRALDRVVALGQTSTRDTGLFVIRIIDARRALDNGDVRYAISMIDVALLH